MKSSTSDLLAYYGQGDERYIPLGYIESSGTQWIDTGVVPTATTKAALELMWLDNTDTYQRVLGSYTGTYRFHIATSSTSWHPGLGDKYGSAGRANHNVRYVAVLDANTRKFYVDEQQLWEAPAAAFASMPSIYLFAQHFGNNAANKACARIYECKLYDGDVLIRDFVPMMCVPSNIPGLYDRVEGRFYENMGTGQFVAGPISAPTDYAFRVSMDTWTGSADTGETFSGTGSPIPTTYMSKTCCRVDNGVKVSAYHLFKYAGTGNPQMTQPYLGCFTCWVANVQPLVMWSGTPLTGVAVQNTVTSITNYVGLGWANNQTALNVGAWAGSNKIGDIANNDTAWHFMAVNMTVDTGWQFKPYTVYPYIDGVMYGEKTMTMNNVEMSLFFINNSNSKSFSFYLKDIRMYDRHLTEEELNVLYIQGL